MNDDKDIKIEELHKDVAELKKQLAYISAIIVTKIGEGGG